MRSPRSHIVMANISVDILLLSSGKKYVDLLTLYGGQICIGTLYVSSFVHLSVDSLVEP